MSNISIIVGIDLYHGIALNNKIPWNNKTDMNFFKEKTQNSCCIMGRNTYQEIHNRKPSPKYISESLGIVCNPPLLKNRMSIVISNTIDDLPDAYVFKTIDKAVTYIKNIGMDIFFIGGVKIFEEAINYVDTIYVNQITYNYNCDTFFPYYLLDDKFPNITITSLDKNLINITFKR